MSGPEELYPPAQYAAGWMLLAFGVLAALVLAACVISSRSSVRSRCPRAAASCAASSAAIAASPWAKSGTSQ
ncbi:hypothetical protein G3H63_19170, partial [Microbacterium resistens]|nr:hypothetical protein [Microbacterium resistens]